MDLSAFFEGVASVFNLVTASSSTTILSAVGLVLLLLTGVMAYIAIKSKPEEMSTFVKVALFLCLIGGILFSAAGPGLAIFYVSQNAIRTRAVDQSFDDLITNARVNYVVRLISYDPIANPELGIDRLKQLGPPKQLYSFVANYNDLVGRTVKDALEAIGIGYQVGQFVSAVIFPLRTRLYPANARGLLQVVHEVETHSDIELKDKFLAEGSTLNGAEIEDLKDTNMSSYQVENLKSLYPHYCQLAQTFYCGRYPARDLVGGLYRDWHPLGFSQKDPPSKPCVISVTDFCAFTNWKTVRSDLKAKFGSRAFLINNLEIDRIPGRILIDFEDPARNVIPDIGAR